MIVVDDKSDGKVHSSKTDLKCVVFKSSCSSCHITEHCEIEEAHKLKKMQMQKMIFSWIEPIKIKGQCFFNYIYILFTQCSWCWCFSLMMSGNWKCQITSILKSSKQIWKLLIVILTISSKGTIYDYYCSANISYSVVLSPVSRKRKLPPMSKLSLMIALNMLAVRKPGDWIGLHVLLCFMCCW